MQNENEIMEAMEGLDSLAEEPNLSIRAVAKLADSEEVRKVPVTVVYTVALMVSSTIHKWWLQILHHTYSAIIKVLVVYCRLHVDWWHGSLCLQWILLLLRSVVYGLRRHTVQAVGGLLLYMTHNSAIFQYKWNLLSYTCTVYAPEANVIEESSWGEHDRGAAAEVDAIMRGEIFLVRVW